MPPPQPPSAPPPPNFPPPLPGVPPIAADKFSRLVFRDLTPDLARLRQNGDTNGTAFVPHSVRILRTGDSRAFLDEPYIEAIHFSQKACPYLPDTPVSEFSDPEFSNSSRSEVSFFANDEKPDCALPNRGRAVTFLNLDEQCAPSVVPGEHVIGLTFEPKCMVITIAPSSRKDLFDQLLAAGRPLDEKLRIEVSYTIALDANPSIESVTTNCQNSFVLYDNYLLDTTLQAQVDELAEVRANRTTAEEVLEFYQYLLDNRPASALRQSLAAYSQQSAQVAQAVANLPPSPPSAPSSESVVAFLNTEIVTYTLREAVLIEEIDECAGFGKVGTRDRPCGISSIEGPNPWLGKDGVSRCRGFDTRSTRLGDFCGFWDSTANIDALAASEKAELLKAGTWCFADDAGSTVVECDGRAQRTQRAGVYELAVRAFTHPSQIARAPF